MKSAGYPVWSTTTSITVCIKSELAISADGEGSVCSCGDEIASLTCSTAVTTGVATAAATVEISSDI